MHALGGLTRRSLTLIGCETALIVGRGCAAYLRLGSETWGSLPSRGGCSRRCSSPPSLRRRSTTPTCTTCVALGSARVFTRLVNALATTSLFLAAVYFWVPALIIGRGVFMIAAVLVITLVIGWRLSIRVAEWPRRARERLLLVGTSQAAVDLRARAVFAAPRTRRGDRRVHRSRSVERSALRSSILASSAPSTTSPRSCRPATWIASSSVWLMRAAPCRWTGCWT